MIDHVYEVIWSVASWLQVSPPYNISSVPPSPGYLKDKQWEGSTLLRESHNNHLKLKVSIFDDDKAELILWYGWLAKKVQPGLLFEISDTMQVGFEHIQNLSSGIFEWNCGAVINTHHGLINHFLKIIFYFLHIFQYTIDGKLQYITKIFQEAACLQLIWTIDIQKNFVKFARWYPR